MSGFDAPIAEQIWDLKYRLKNAAADGDAASSADAFTEDGTVEDTWAPRGARVGGGGA